MLGSKQPKPKDCFWVKCCALVAISCSFSTVLNADVIEGFENGNKSNYSIVTGSSDNLSILSSAAHDGSFGAHFGVGSFSNEDWYLRSDVSLGPDATYVAFVRLDSIGASSDRVYVGVGATASGTWSMVAAGNTSQLLLENDAAYGYSDVSSASFTWAQGVWYQMALDWYANGDMQVKLFDESGSALLTSTPLFSTGDTAPGGLAIRGFYNADLDTITRSALAVPEPSSLAVLVAALGGLEMLRIRQRRERGKKAPGMRHF
jgi:hypothetical protein